MTVQPGYFTYEELTEKLKRLESDYPDLAHLQSIGKSPEGRDIWILTVGVEPERIRPALWIDGNMHAAEIAGTSVCITFAEFILEKLNTLKSKNSQSAQEETLNGLLYYICPRISPDGAQRFITKHEFVRSVPRDRQMPPTKVPRWQSEDIDGDGLVRFMRIEDSAGSHVADPNRPGLMLVRELGDEGPFYKMYREGTIDQWDGKTIPPTREGVHSWMDLNRNFPFNWKAPHEQAGSGDYPLSEPESRAVVDFAVKHPNIFSWINYHCFGGVYIRPPGYQSDSKMPLKDLETYKTLGGLAEKITGYRMVSGFEEFLYVPETPLYGSLSEWAYEHRGAISMVCELWDLFKRLGVEKKPMIKSYEDFTRANAQEFFDWDTKNNQGRSFKAFTKFNHPQLGSVEIGGVDSRFGIWNPPPEMLPEVAQKQVEFLQEIASTAPRLNVAFKKASDGSHTKLNAKIKNLGFLSTGILGRAEELAIHEPIHVSLTTTGSLELSAGDHEQKIGQLLGWGEGTYSGHIPAYVGSHGTHDEKTLTWSAKGSGDVILKVGNQRLGFVESKIAIN